MKVYICGNESLSFDSAPFRFLQKLKKEFKNIEFLPADPNENFPPNSERTLYILDTVALLEKPMLITIDDFIDLKKTPVSPHDYDLLFHLLLLKKMGKINTVHILGIPSFWKDEKMICALLKEMITMST